MTELSLNILDIANNSTRANAKNIEIEIGIDTVSDKLTITITDDGCGMSEQFLKEVISPFGTTRTTRKVGMGIPLFKMISEMCGGALILKSKIGAGTTISADFQLSHVDRPPLGDVASTITTLIGGAAETEFTLKYCLNKNEYVFSTAEVKKALGENDLSDNIILSYLKDMINENIEIINGGITI